MHKGENSKDTWNIKQGIETYLEIDNYIRQYSVLNSKKQLMLMLSIEEFEWKQTGMRIRQLIELSYQLVELIQFRLFFYAHLFQAIQDRLRMLSCIKSEYNQMYSIKKEIISNLEGVKKVAQSFEKELVEDAQWAKFNNRN